MPESEDVDKQFNCYQLALLSLFIICDAITKDRQTDRQTDREQTEGSFTLIDIKFNIFVVMNGQVVQ